MFDIIGKNTRSTKRFVDALDTVAASSFIRKDDLQMKLNRGLRPLKGTMYIQNASGHKIPISRTVELKL